MRIQHSHQRKVWKPDRPGLMQQRVNLSMMKTNPNQEHRQSIDRFPLKQGFLPATAVSDMKADSAKNLQHLSAKAVSDSEAKLAVGQQHVSAAADSKEWAACRSQIGTSNISGLPRCKITTGGRPRANLRTCQ